MSYGPNEFQTEFDVSHETMARLAAYDATLVDGSTRHNLIARSTLDTRWDRHFRDSAQLFAALPPDAARLVDIGAGAGFPGLVLAAMGAERGLDVTLVESIGKKAAFLASAITAMRLENARVLPQRIESITVSPPDVVTARALARLVKLLEYAAEFSAKSTRLIFPKGQDVEDELTEAAKYWHMSVERRPSLTSPGSTILVIRNFSPKPGAANSSRLARNPRQARRQGRAKKARP
ncbi:MAG: 16S rRNA (guanine(527)-N(7))-methyltransferase RsmG [Parvularculaceae bacterium]